jgi:RHS repeat-associated protein
MTPTPSTAEHGAALTAWSPPLDSEWLAPANCKTIMRAWATTAHMPPSMSTHPLFECHAANESRCPRSFPTLAQTLSPAQQPSIRNTFTVWVKGTGTVASFYSYYNGTTNLSSNWGPAFTLTGAWQQWTGTYTPPAATTSFQLVFSNTVAAAVWYADDVSITTGGGGSSPVAITAPAGWIQQADQTATGVRTTTFTKVAGGAEPASYAFTMSAATKSAAALSAFVGVDNTTPVDVAASQVNVSGLSHVAPSVTTTGANRLVVAVNGLATSTSLTPQSGSTELVDSAATAGAPTVTVETSSSPAASAGATGTRTSASLLAAVSATSTITLRPVTTGGGVMVSNTVTRSQTGRMLTSTVDTLVDGFEYDTAGRLCRANLSSKTNVYRYGGTACQLVTTGIGANANRTQTDETIGGTTTSVTYGYDTADKLTSVSGQTAPSYNVRGQTLTVAGQTLTWDGADRNVTVAEGATTVSYARDATDRIVARTSGATVTRYGFTGGGDTPDIVMNGTGTVIEQMYPLPGGVTLTKRGAVQVWSYPNIHGDVAAVANATGVKQGATFLYDPFGQPITTAGAVSPDLVPDNADQEFDFGSLGQHQRGYEHSANITITQMGARPYLQGSGRFLSIDPVEGGTSNDYTYVDDPVNTFDLTGTVCWSCWGRKAINNTINLPFTLGAKIAAKSAGAKCENHKGMNVCYGASGWVKFLMPKSGITLGGTIIFTKKKADVSATFLAHEVSHGSQWATFGLAGGPFGYGVAYGASALAGSLLKTCSPMERWANYGRRHGC